MWLPSHWSLVTGSLCPLLYLLSSPVSAQWQHTYGGMGTDEGVDVLATADGGCVVLGSTGSFGQGTGDIYLFRLDAEGQRLWSRTYGSPQTEQATSLAACPEGGFIIAGNRSGTTGYNGLLVRVDDNGDLLWEREYGGDDWDFAYAVKAMDTGFVVAGQTYSYGAVSGDAWLFTTDLEGEVQWNFTHGTDGTDEARDIVVASNGDLLVAGTFHPAPPASSAAVVFRVDGTGDPLWTVPLGGEGDERAYGLTATQDGAFVLSGWTESILPERTMYMTKLTGTGDQLWTRYTEGGEGAWEGRRIHELSDGTLVVAGYTEAFGNGGRDMYMWHTDADGYYIQGPTFGGVDDETGAAVVGTADGGFIVVGSADSFGPGIQGVYVVKNFGSPDIPDVQVFDDPLSIPNEVFMDKDVTIYPNPARKGDDLYFQPQMGSRYVTSIKWIASCGIIAHASTRNRSQHPVTIEVPDLSPGVYMVRMETSESMVFSSRMVIIP